MTDEIKHAILPAADAELDAAVTWYELQREGLGLELLAEFRERLLAALRVPGAGALAGYTTSGDEIRRYRLRRFARYSIIIATVRGTPTVLAVAHSSRRPGYWQRRLK